MLLGAPQEGQESATRGFAPALVASGGLSPFESELGGAGGAAFAVAHDGSNDLEVVVGDWHTAGGDISHEGGIHQEGSADELSVTSWGGIRH